MNEVPCQGLISRVRLKAMKSLLRLLSSFGVMVSLLAALSLAAAGGTHRIANMDTSQAAFMQAFGQEAEICGEVGGKSSVSPDCPVCHLVSAVVLPDPVQSPEGIELRFVAQDGKKGSFVGCSGMLLYLVALRCRTATENRLKCC